MSVATRFLLLCAAALPAILSAAITYAEHPDLFTPLLTNQLEISPAQTQRINLKKQRPTTESVTLVRVDADTLKSDSIRTSLPGGAKTLSFSKSNIEMRSVNDFTWFGALSGVPGKAIFVVHDGDITGTIRDDSNLYRVEPVGNGVHALIKVDQSRFPPDEPPTFPEREKRSDARLRSAPKSDNPVGIDVLVAYTTAARTAVSDITATIQLAVAETNQSYQNSNINIKLTMVDSFEVPYSEGWKSMYTILDDFAGMEDIKNSRNKSGADMAVLIIDQSNLCGLPFLPDCYCGLGYTLPDASNAFAVVNYDCATGYYSFAHELGHVQGAEHDLANDDTPTTPFAYNHGFQHTSPAPSWRTIMAYDCEGGCPRLQYWSSPNITYNDLPMGTAETHDNARVLNETATKVAGFKPAACTLLYPSSSTPPSGFGASWNLFSTAKELLLGATCSGSNLNVVAGNNQPTTFIHKIGYYWDGTAWQSYAFSGSVPNGDWFQNAAQATIPKIGISHFLAYTCQYISESWKCGCADTVCNTSYWQLQSILGGPEARAMARLHPLPSARVPDPPVLTQPQYREMIQALP